MERTRTSAGERNAFSDIRGLREQHADDLASLRFVDVDVPNARNGDGPGGNDDGP